ncbi:hypothetical protein KGF56_003164 [Candida oxycetoniae]|uniref:Uncharacterized protein n=1 Tax=Candida oxycetoniae TaxID=497107 RepID=A0AAI9WXQ1_9ASCO|nr:uncharacterized protein KGF56_003164 [Candida oxycetoniae]KAI3404005.2 hypothetical protein KGF56_003164 [Candida oxycetoniae]
MTTLMDIQNLTEENSDGEEDYDSDYTSLDIVSTVSSSQYQISAQEQWEESMKQIQTLLSLIIFPLIGKLLGRRTSKFIWRKFADWWFP